MTFATMKKEAEDQGFVLKRVKLGVRILSRWTTQCGCCGKEKVWGWGINHPPHLLVKNLRQGGWGHDKRGPVCEECITKERTKMNTKIEQTVVPNPKLQRKVFALLDDHFDEQTRLYASGWSDKKIADEAQTSEQFVESLRRGAYGELAEDPIISLLKADIESLQKEHKQREDKWLTEMSDMSDRIAELQERLHKLSVKRVA